MFLRRRVAAAWAAWAVTVLWVVSVVMPLDEYGRESWATFIPFSNSLVVLAAVGLGLGECDPLRSCFCGE